MSASALRQALVPALCMGLISTFGADAKGAEADDVVRRCLPKRYAVVIEESFEDKRSNGRVIMNVRGEAQARIPLVFEGGVLRGQSAVEMKVRERGRSGRMSCTASRIIDIAWSLDGVVSDACVIAFQASRKSKERSYVLTCNTDAGPNTIFMPTFPEQSRTILLQLKAEAGATVVQKIDEPRNKELRKVTLIEDVPVP
jgi:hypothetical protein